VISTWVLIVGVFGAAGLLNLWLLRTRPGDLDRVQGLVEARGLRVKAVRRGMLRLQDRAADGSPSSWRVSRATRVFAVVAEGSDGDTLRLRIGIDPWRDNSTFVLR
jgi:hypothetical protein